jgi:hypothetical protein
MSVSDLGSRSGRFGAASKIRPFSSSSDVVSAGRPTASVTAGRTAGVGRTTTSTPLLATATGPQMVAEAVATALQSLKALHRHAVEVAGQFRQGQTTPARQGLRDLVHGTETLVQLAALSAQVLGLDLCSIPDADGMRAESDTRAVVDQLMAQLLGQDWQGVAQTLEADFVGALGEWAAVLEALGDTPTTFSGPAA